MAYNPGESALNLLLPNKHLCRLEPRIHVPTLLLFLTVELFPVMPTPLNPRLSHAYEYESIDKQV